MTDELIDLEYAHMDLDKKLKGGKEEFEDDSYEEWDKDTEVTDSVLSYEYAMPTEVQASEAGKPTPTAPDKWEEDEEDWDDVGTHDSEN